MATIYEPPTNAIIAVLFALLAMGATAYGVRLLARGVMHSVPIDLIRGTRDPGLRGGIRIGRVRGGLPPSGDGFPGAGGARSRRGTLRDRDRLPRPPPRRDRYDKLTGE